MGSSAVLQQNWLNIVLHKVRVLRDQVGDVVEEVLRLIETIRWLVAGEVVVEALLQWVHLSMMLAFDLMIQH